MHRESPADSTETVPGSCHCQALRQAARRATALYDLAMARHGLRISQFSILARLHRSGPLSLQALAGELLLDRTTLGRNLLPLERDGLVASLPDAADRRVRRLVLTPPGLALLQRAMPAWDQAQREFETQFGVEPAASLRADLYRLTQTLTDTATVISDGK